MANNQRLNAIITVGATMSGTVRSAMRGVAGQLNSVGREIQGITRQQRDLEQQRAIWQREGRAVGDLDRQLEGLNRRLDDLRRRQERLRRISDGLGNVGTAASRAFRTVAYSAGIATAAIGVTGAAVLRLVTDTAKLGDDAATVAAQIGMQASALQELQFAAEQSDVATADFNASMETMVRNIGLAERGLGRARPALEALGLSAEELGRMLPEDALGLIADRLNDVETQAGRVSIATQLFGGAGADMALMLSAGSEGLQAFRDDARALGLVLSDEALAAAGAFDNELRRSRLAMQGLRNTIGAALIPTVTELASEFTAFVVENRPLIAEFATTLGQTFRDAIPVIAEVVTGLGNVAGAVGSVLAFVADLLGGWDNLGIAVGAAFVAPSIIAIGRLGIAIAGLIAATGPVGLVIAGVAAAAALIIGNWDSIKAGAVAAWEAIKTGAGVAFDWIAEKVGWLAESGFLGPIGLIIAHWDEVKAAGLEAWSALQDGAQAAVDWVVEKFEWLSGRVTALLAPIREAFGFVGSTIERVGNWWSDRERGGLAPGNYTNPVDEFGNVQTRRRGGPMMPGATLVGEGGPEMIFPSRAAYVATARQTRALTEGGGGRTLNVGGITINAGALSDPRAIADEVLRVLTDRERAAMYDGGLA